MPSTDDPLEKETRQGARRLGVMWVCWIVLAIFLVAAGVCVFG